MYLYATMVIWREIQKKNFRDWRKLSEFLQLNPQQIAELLPSTQFPLNLPLRLAEKIAKNTLEDPILKQFVPLKKELQEAPGFQLDPVQDASFRKSSKLLHKYQGRALLVCTSACAMNCRFCFRQNFTYATSPEQVSFTEELSLIRKDSSLTEIILSGGDPLSLSHSTLAHLIHELDAVAHLKKLRFHTRFPIGIPERIDIPFLDLLASTRLQIIFVIHCNHPKELDDDVLAVLKKIQKLGIPVLNQCVLLSGVNDRVQILHDLYEKLTNHGILPYYLHGLDKVKGASHFEVDEETGKALIRVLSSQLPGYAVPKYVKEIPGNTSKTPLG
jgi:EF-P beta-lysylation protein EpmB